jgi:predicted acyltransferase (DUF342 family)
MIIKCKILFIFRLNLIKYILFFRKNKKPKLIKNDDDDDDESKSKKTDEIWSSFKNDVKSASSITNTCSKEIGNINNTQINNKTVATSKSITSTNSTNLVKTRPKGGIAGILNKINKQPKISTLVSFFRILFNSVVIFSFLL